MFFEFMSRLLSFDLIWIAGLIFGNLHYVFLFAAVCFFFFGPNIKKTVVSVILLSLVAWTWVDFELMSGWLLFVGGFLSIYYLTKIIVVIFANDVPALKNHLVIINELQFLAILLIYNFFLR